MQIVAPLLCNSLSRSITCLPLCESRFPEAHLPEGLKDCPQSPRYGHALLLTA